MLIEAIRAVTKNMCAMYELSGGVEQDVEKGAFREFFVAQLIRPFMPPHFGIGSGVLVDYYERQSRQSDVIIYDRRLLPPILLAGDRGIFPIDSVLAVIEVKSCLKASDYSLLEDASRRVSPYSEDNPQGLHIKTKARTPNGKARYPLYAVFAYTSDAIHKDEAERLEEQVPNSYNFIRLICVLDKGVWSYNEAKEKCMRHNDVEDENISVRFLLQLLNKLEDVAEQRGKYRLQDWIP